MSIDSRLELLLDRVDNLLERVGHLLPGESSVAPAGAASAYRWRSSGEGRGALKPVARPSMLKVDELLGIDHQKAELLRNTRQFVSGLPANNVLLTGARGTGKSSLVKAMLSRFGGDGLCMVELERFDVIDLHHILDTLEGRDGRYILFCDDLSFEAGDGTYKALKAALDGSLSEVPDNVVIYATSNRRHLMPEYMQENLQARMVDGEIHQGEAVEEKISLSERFGMWLSFQPFNQAVYLEVVHAWLNKLGHRDPSIPEVNEAALRWALRRGSRSGRSAWQFARDWVGRKGL